MDILFEKITEGLRNLLIQAITACLSGLFTQMNEATGQVTGELSATPKAFSPALFETIRSLHAQVAVPIAGIVITFVLCAELIRMVSDANNYALTPEAVSKWLVKAVIAVLVASNAFTIIMGIFDLGTWIAKKAGGVIEGASAMEGGSLILSMRLPEKSAGELLFVLILCLLLRAIVFAVTIGVTIIIYARIVEIYLYASVAAIPLSTVTGREMGSMGRNYVKGMVALMMQGFFIMVCVGMYNGMIAQMGEMDDAATAFTQIAVITVLLFIALFRSGQIARSIFEAH